VSAGTEKSARTRKKNDVFLTFFLLVGMPCCNIFLKSEPLCWFGRREEFVSEWSRMSSASGKNMSDGPTNVDLATEVFAEHGSFIRSVIRFHIDNKTEAEDLFQDLFLFLISKPIPTDVQNVKGFLYKMICDMVRDAFRRIERYHERIHVYAKRNSNVMENRPESGLMEVEEAKKMFELIERRLPRNEAQAVMLKYRENNGVTEIAEKMGVKPRSVSRYVSVGLKKIRGVFAEEDEGGYDSC
jgi:RNA polymerase sigma factor (sigma-70 family)